VSIRGLPSAYPVEWRSIWTWIGERQTSDFSSSLDHTGNSHPAEREAALVDDVRQNGRRKITLASGALSQPNAAET
jgi:hypothetical protein